MDKYNVKHKAAYDNESNQASIFALLSIQKYNLM